MSRPSQPRPAAARRLLAALGVAALSACAQPSPQAAVREETARATADVVALDREERDIVLRLADGEILEARLGPEVRRLDEIAVGDRVVAEVLRSVAVRMAEAGETAPTGAVVGGRAGPESAPGVAAAAAVERTFEVVSYDPATGQAVLRNEAGALVRLTVHPEMRDFAARRAPGDLVRVMVTEAVAISVIPGG